MKIAVFHNLPKGGALRVAQEQIKRLRKNHQLDLFTLPLIARFPDFIKEARFCRHISRPKNDFFKLWTLKKFHQQLAQEIDGKKYDLVLVHPCQHTQAPYLLRFLKTPSVYYAHETLRIGYEKHFQFQEKVSFFKTIYEKVYRFLLKRADYLNVCGATKIISNSQQTKKMAWQAYRIKTAVCYPGIDSNQFRPLAKIKKEVILFVGQPSPLNGFDLVQKALKYLQSPPQIRIVKGELTEGQLLQAYSQAFLTVCASFQEPLGLVPLESMACQTPVVAVKEGGYQETILDEKTGFLVRRHPKVFAQKIELLLKNPRLAEKMGKRGREYVKKEWPWSKSIKRLEKFLEDR